METGARPAFLRGRDAVVAYPVTAGGVRTRVLESLGEGGRPVVCLHGAGSRADRFAPVVPGLTAAGLHVYAIDLPGHGFADKGAGFDYTARGFADHVALVLDELGLRDVVLVGTSLGGHVSSHVALSRPDLVSELILVGCVGVVALPEENMTDPQVMAEATPEAVARKLTGFVLADAGLLTGDWVREESAINTSAGAHDALSAVGEFLRWGCNADLVGEALARAGVDAHTLVVWGEDDRWTPLAMGEATRHALPGAAWATMPGCGHAPYFERPDLFVQILTDHLDARR